jgi:hypothetical protein
MHGSAAADDDDDSAMAVFSRVVGSESCKVCKHCCALVHCSARACTALLLLHIT